MTNLIQCSHHPNVYTTTGECPVCRGETDDVTVVAFSAVFPMLPSPQGNQFPGNCAHAGEMLSGGCCGRMAYWECRRHGEADALKCAVCPDFMAVQ